MTQEIRLQAGDVAKLKEGEMMAKEQEEKARVRLDEVYEEIKNVQTKLKRLDSEKTELEKIVTDLFIKANIGDYVSYVGEGDRMASTWRVWKKEGSSVIITGCGHRKLYLYGVEDYLDIVKNAGTQTDKINQACKRWYVNQSHGITAENIRSMTIEDIEWACGITPPEIKRYAFYPKGTSVSGTIMYDGNTYTKLEYHRDRKNIYDPEDIYAIPEFYTYDGGGIEKVDIYGYNCREPEKDNPVYISDASRYYSLSSCEHTYTHVDNKRVKAGEILVNGGWLASAAQCVDNSEEPRAGIYIAGVGVVFVADLQAGSSISQFSERLPLHPLISLDNTFKVIGGNGTETEPWEISRE